MIVLLIGKTSVESIVFITILVAIAGQPFYILLDGYTSIFAKNNGYQYSKIRLFGSLSYALSTLAAGYVIKFYGFGTAFLYYRFFSLLLRRCSFHG